MGNGLVSHIIVYFFAFTAFLLSHLSKKTLLFPAHTQRWPLYAVTGAFHGVALATLGLIGDLTASMMKRDAGLKDFGNLLPEHGGVLDRVDSFIFSAPYTYFVIRFALPFLRRRFR